MMCVRREIVDAESGKKRSNWCAEQEGGGAVMILYINHLMIEERRPNDAAPE